MTPTTSDARVKTDIRPIKNALSKIARLKGYVFKRTDRNEEDGERTNLVRTKDDIGFLAQDVLAVVPEVVTFDKKNDRYGLDYGNLTALLAEGVNEMSKRLDVLKERDCALEKQLRLLTARVEDLETYEK